MDLTTQCPQCGSTFSVSLSQLQLRKGFIRCGNCAHIFDGYEAVVPSEPATGSVLDSQPAAPAFPPSAAPAQQPADPYARPNATTAPPPGPQRASVPAALRPVITPVSAPVQAPRPSTDLSRTSPADGRPQVVRQRLDEQNIRAPSTDAKATGEPSSATFTISSTAHASHAGRVDPVITNFQPASRSRPEPIVPPTPSLPIRGRQARVDPVAVVPTATGRDAQNPGHDSGRHDHASGYADQKPEYVDHDPAYVDRDAVQAVRSRVYVEPRADNLDDDTDAIPDFLDHKPARYRGFAFFFWGVMVLLGLLVLLAQVAYVYRVQLASEVPFLRPMLVQACTSLHCTVAYPRDIKQIAIMSSSLRSKGKAVEGKDGDQDQMTLQVTLRNNLDRPQEWPTLILSLMDFSGAEVVKKNLPPQAYLSPAALKGPFAASSETAITVPITLNGIKVSGFQLDKFFP